MPDHDVRRGECMASIADQYGFFWETLWNLADNSELKQLRKDPNVLFPSDVVFIPEKRRREESVSTEQRHAFLRKGVPEKLIIILKIENEARADTSCVIDIEGKTHKLKSDPDGRVEIPIPPGARHGRLTVPDTGEVFELDLGGLDPIDELTGVQGRLASLGFPVEVSGQLDEATGAAIRDFQRREDLDVSGEPDDPTRSKLQERFGS